VPNNKSIDAEKSEFPPSLSSNRQWFEVQNTGKNSFLTIQNCFNEIRIRYLYLLARGPSVPQAMLMALEHPKRIQGLLLLDPVFKCDHKWNTFDKDRLKHVVSRLHAVRCSTLIVFTKNNEFFIPEKGSYKNKCQEILARIPNAVFLNEDINSFSTAELKNKLEQYPKKVSMKSLKTNH
jgi:hypothetical protein